MNTPKNTPVVPRNILFPFILLTSCFAGWGLANNMTDTLLAFFKRMMSMSDFQTSWIQMAFYGAYFCLAIPAALIVQRFSYKVGVLFGLGTFTLGGLLFYPSSLLFAGASDMMRYTYFLISLYILAGGCSILETAANPYILAMGPAETATRRLNLAQSFNPLGSIIGVLLSTFFILSRLSPLDAEDRAIMEAIDPKSLETLQISELQGAMGTYVGVSLVLVVIWFAILFCRMPVCSAAPIEKGIARNLWSFISIPFDAFHFNKGSFFDQMRQVLSHRNYLWGVIAQFFYVGAQICVWSYTIRYVMQELNVLEAHASWYYTVTLVVFIGMRFVCTGLMKYISPNILLAFMSGMAVICCLGVMFGKGMMGVISLISISGCMSLMFPTIYGIASEGLGEKVKIGGCGLIMAIVGGAIITVIQGRISDSIGIGLSYIVPAICFIVTGYYGLMTEKGAEYKDGKTTMPKIPGMLFILLGIAAVGMTFLCINSHRSQAVVIESSVEGSTTQYYLSEHSNQKGTFDVVELVRLSEPNSPFKGIIRYYSVRNLKSGEEVLSEDITYFAVGNCVLNQDKLTVRWAGAKKDEILSWSESEDKLKFRDRDYQSGSLQLNHLSLTEEIMQRRLEKQMDVE